MIKQQINCESHPKVSTDGLRVLNNKIVEKLILIPVLKHKFFFGRIVLDIDDTHLQWKQFLRLFE